MKTQRCRLQHLARAHTREMLCSAWNDAHARDAASRAPARALLKGLGLDADTMQDPYVLTNDEAIRFVELSKGLRRPPRTKGEFTRPAAPTTGVAQRGFRK